MANIVKQSGRIMPQAVKQAACLSTSACRQQEPRGQTKAKSTRFIEFQKKLREKAPFASFVELSRQPFQEIEALRPWPNNTNPYTGEIGGPSGPEPTRYGDWERKGRVSDF
uniref:Succinate dehydrogenase assembly factor 4, mitochondrial n=1 Tax=Glossina morsitans morsitans TaxID=37546 RepID=D3TMZ4_GLOMM